MATARPLENISRLVLRQPQPVRRLHTSYARFTATTHPSKQRDAQDDRHKMNPEANEYAKSGTDDAAAKQEEAAFDPNITDPQEAKKKAAEGNDVNPLDASPANVELSQKEGTREDTAGAQK